MIASTPWLQYKNIEDQFKVFETWLVMEYGNSPLTQNCAEVPVITVSHYLVTSNRSWVWVSLLQLVFFLAVLYRKKHCGELICEMIYHLRKDCLVDLTVDISVAWCFSKWCYVTSKRAIREQRDGKDLDEDLVAQNFYFKAKMKPGSTSTIMNKSLVKIPAEWFSSEYQLRLLKHTNLKP
jgi:hypothetical protein